MARGGIDTLTSGQEPEAGNRIARAIPRWGARPLNARLLLLSLLVGAASGGVAIALYWGIAVGTHLLLGPLGYQPAAIAASPGGFHPAIGPAHWARWFLPLVTAGGALLATTLIYWFAPETRGHGTDNAINAINTDPTGIRVRAVPVKLIATALTLGSGGSGGTEGPTAQMAATTASVIARVSGLDYRQARMMVAAGLAAGVGAIFRAPIGGAVLGVELLFRDDADPEMLVPSMIASFAGYLVFSTKYGFTPMFGHVPGLDLRFSAQLVAFPLLGVVAGGLARLFCFGFYKLADWFEGQDDRPIPRPVRAAGAGFVVGIIGLFIPGVLGTGYGAIQQVLSPGHVLGLSVLVLILMPLMKIAATALTVGSGGSGGVFGPGMVIGATAGAALWRVLEPLGLAPASPASLVMLGLAACLGAASRAPVAITLIAAEVCGSISLLEPAVIVVPIAVLIVGKETLYRSQPSNRQALARALAERPSQADDRPSQADRPPVAAPPREPESAATTAAAADGGQSLPGRWTANPSRAHYAARTADPAPDPDRALPGVSDNCPVYLRWPRIIPVYNRGTPIARAGDEARLLISRRPVKFIRRRLLRHERARSR